MELKDMTLKDVITPKGYFYPPKDDYDLLATQLIETDIHLLKQWVIAKVKELIKQRKQFNDGSLKLKTDHSGAVVEGQISWIMANFNLTEKDL